MFSYLKFTVIVPILPDYLFRIEHPRLEQLLHTCAARESKVSEYELNAEHVYTLLHDLHKQLNTTSDVCRLIHNSTNQISPFRNTIINEKLLEENGRIGLLLSSKPLFELATNPVVGIIVNMIGSTFPMIFGFALMLASIMGFAFGHTYTQLFIARSIQGVASSFTTIGIGPVYGGLLYTQFGKSVPFFILAALALIDGALRISMFSRISWHTQHVEDTNETIITKIKNSISALFTLARDPLIAIGVGIPMLTMFGVATLEVTLPIFMMRKLRDSSPLMQGLVFLPFSIATLLSQNLFAWLSFHIGRWICELVGLLLAALALFLVSITNLS
ncbi:unnamed protein product [Adineta steineri]|uniref:Uncharacterized protein n=1 Tax=Adineta steineri TaxID=433720 RepID=A0A814VA70_9BILA|nr:unnamed protein product [Adineta steineri]CAF3824576.1 unnamed protein product [Adineta steineri]